MSHSGWEHYSAAELEPTQHHLQLSFTIYKAFILPNLNYCDIRWSSVGTTLAKRLDRLQKRTARVVLREGSNNDPVSHLGWTKRASIKPGTWNIPEDSGTSRNMKK